MDQPDVLTRLRALRIEIDPQVRVRHLDEIASALTQPVVRRRRWVAVAAMAAALSLPAAAVAAESALPGDLLYPVKQALEPVRGLLDDTIAARHRLEELETMLATDVDQEDLESQVTAAEAAVSAIDDPELEALLARLRSSVVGTGGPVVDDDEPVDGPVDEPVTTVADTDPPVRETSPPVTDATTPPTDEGGDDGAVDDTRPVTERPPTTDPPVSDEPPPTDPPPETDAPPRDESDRGD